MKKFLAFALAAMAAAVVFTACGDSSSSSSSQGTAPSGSQSSTQSEAQNVSGENAAYNLNDLVTAIEQVNPVENAKEVDDDYLTLGMLLNADNIVEYAGKVSNNQGNSALIVAIRAAEGKADEVKTELNAYKSSISTGGLYKEFANMEAMAKDARIVAKGDYLVMVVANTQGADYAEIDKALDEALK